MAIVTDDRHFSSPENVRIGDSISSLRDRFANSITTYSDGSATISLPSGWCAWLPNPALPGSCHGDSPTAEANVIQLSIQNSSFCGVLCPWRA